MKQEIVWTDKLPIMEDAPNWKDTDLVIDELKKHLKGENTALVRTSALLSGIWHRGFFITNEHPEHDLTNMSRWLMTNYQIDLTPNDLRIRIVPYDTFSPFGDSVMKWLQPFSQSTKYELARSVRLVLKKEPLEMESAEMVEALSTIIIPSMAVCPFGTSVRDVLKNLTEADIVPKKFLPGIKTRGPRGNVGVLETIRSSDDGMIDGMFIMRQIKKTKPTSEFAWRDWCKAYCDEHDVTRDQAFEQIMLWAMEKWPIPVKKAA